MWRLPLSSFAPAPADLKDPFVPGSQKPFHTELRGGVKEPASGRDCIDVGFGCRGGNAVRGLYFEIAPADEKSPDLLEDGCSCRSASRRLANGPFLATKLSLDAG